MINKNVRVLIASNNEGVAIAREFAGLYSRIFMVVYSEIQMRYETAIKMAEEKNMTHMLYFLDDTNLLLASLADEMGGYTLEATVDDLKKVLSQNAYDSL